MRYLLLTILLLSSLKATELANRPVLKGLLLATIPVDCVLETDPKKKLLDINTYIETYSNGDVRYAFTKLDRRLEKPEIELEFFKRTFGKRDLLVKESELSVSDEIIFHAELFDGKSQSNLVARLYSKDDVLVIAIIESIAKSKGIFSDLVKKFFEGFKVLDRDFNPIYHAYVSDEVKLLDSKFETFQSNVLKENVKEAQVAGKYHIPYPLPVVSLSQKEIETKAKKLSEEEADKFYPLGDKELKQIQETANKQYPLYKIGDTVKLTIQRGGVSPVVVGPLKGFTQSGVKIGNRLVSNLDLTKEQFAYFDPKLNEEFRKAFFKETLQAKRLKRYSFIENQVKEYELKLYKSSNYTYNRKKKKWISYQDHFAPYFKREQKIYLVKNLKKMKIDFYTSLGYGVLNDQSGARWKSMAFTIPIDDLKKFSQPNFTYEDVTPIERKQLYDKDF